MRKTIGKCKNPDCRVYYELQNWQKYHPNSDAMMFCTSHCWAKCQPDTEYAERYRKKQARFKAIYGDEEKESECDAKIMKLSHKHIDKLRENPNPKWAELKKKAQEILNNKN